MQRVNEVESYHARRKVTKIGPMRKCLVVFDGNDSKYPSCLIESLNDYEI